MHRRVRRRPGTPASGRPSRTARPARPGRPARRRTPRPRATARPTTCAGTTASSRADTAAAVAWWRAWRSASTRARASNSRALSTTPIMPRGQGGAAAACGAADPPASYSRAMGEALLEVTVLDPRDVPGAEEGGADRLHLVAPGATRRSRPSRRSCRRCCRETDLPVFVLLRLNDSWTTTGGELTRLVGLAEDYLGCGAAGVSFGFLDADLEIDTEVCAHLAASLPGRAVDLPPRRRRHPRPAPLLAPAASGCPAWSRSARPARRRGSRVGVRRPARHRRRRPGGRPAADARRRAARRARAVVRPGRGPAVPPRDAGAPGCVVQVLRRRRPRPLLAAAARQRRRARRRRRSAA